MSTARCSQCGRPIQDVGAIPLGRRGVPRTHRPIVRVVVNHEEYGCSSGCCGYQAVGLDADGHEVCRSEFSWRHPRRDDLSEEQWAVEREQFAIAIADNLTKMAPLDLAHCDIPDCCPNYD